MHSLKVIADRKLRLRHAAAICGAVVACATLPAYAADKSAAVTTPAAQSASEAAPGMVIVRDAATGRLRAPTRDEANELGHKAAADIKARVAARNVRKAGAAATQSLSVDAGAGAGTFVTAKGILAAKLDESSYSYAVVTRKADGTLAMGCVDGADNAAKALRDGVVAEDHSPANASTASNKESNNETK